MIIYLITNKINGKRYVGQTIKSLSTRWSKHKYEAKTGKWDYPLHRAIRKYGQEFFESCELEKCSSIEELNEAEIFYINFYNSLAPENYNLHTGGNNHIVSEECRLKMSQSRLGKKHTPQTIEKISNAQKGKIITPEAKLKMSVSHTGKVLTQKHKDNIRAVNVGKKLSDNHIEKIGQSHIGKTFTQEHRDNMSKSRLGKVLSSEKRENISKGHVGVAHSEETKRKLSEKNKGKKPNVGEIKPIFCHQTGEIYKSFGNAAKSLKIHRPGIQRSLKSGLPYHGYTFEYYKEDKK